MNNKIKKFKVLKSRWDNFKVKNPKVRIRDAAFQLATSEAELLSTGIEETVQYLSIKSFNDFFIQILSLDKLMLLIRSNSVVHEKTYFSNNINLIGNQIIDKNNSIIISFNKNYFKHFFFESKKHKNKILKSIQIFDENGEASLKIYYKGKKIKKFEELALASKVKYQYELQLVENDSTIETPTNYQNKISFEFNICRSEKKYFDCSTQSLRLVLEKVSKQKIPVQIHALGKGSVQYHRGRIFNLVDYGPWLNIIDKNFNLHLLESELKKSVLVEYICEEGKYYSLEFYDNEKKHLLGISSTKGFEKSFNEIINNLK